MEEKKPAIIVESRLLEEEVVPLRILGPRNIYYMQQVAEAVSSSGMSFVCPPPTENVNMDKNVQLVIPVRLTFTATDVPVDSLIFKANYCNLRSFPFQRACARMQLIINNVAFDYESGHLFPALEHFSTTAKSRNGYFSTAPSYGSGQSQSYNDLVGGNRSELATYADSIDGVAPQNFPFRVISQTNDGLGTAVSVIEFVTVEDLQLSPLYFGEPAENIGSFKDIQTMELNFTLMNNAGFRMVGIDNIGAGLGSGTISVSAEFDFTANGSNFTYRDKQPKALITYLKPEVDTSPKLNAFKYHRFLSQSVVDPDGSLASGSSRVIEGPNMLLNVCPTKVFIYAKRPRSSYTTNPYLPDAFCAIETIQLSWNNKVVMNNIHKSKLFKISQSNGLQYEYASWSGEGLNLAVAPNIFGTSDYQFGGCGTIICLDVLDFGITLEQQRAMRGEQYNLQVNATVTNIASDAFVPELFCVVLIDGYCVGHEKIFTKKDYVPDYGADVVERMYKELHNSNSKINIPVLTRQRR